MDSLGRFLKIIFSENKNMKLVCLTYIYVESFESSHFDEQDESYEEILFSGSYVVSIIK